MFKHISIPPFFTLIKKGKVFALLKDGYKEVLLRQGIDDLETFLKKNSQTSRYYEGRTLHPSIPLGDGKNSMVLRQYSHGGLLRAITGSLYLFGSRSFRELAITEEIRSCGIPTIEPIGAIHRVADFPIFYRAYLLTLEVPGVNAIQYLEKIGERPGRETLRHKRIMIKHFGLMLRQFHQSGFFHRDLQLKNILVVGDRILIIDFDRSYRKRIISTGERMKNVLRLNRSVEKWRQVGLPITRTDRWRFFLSYAGEDKEIRKAMERALHTYSLRSLFYRFSWAIEKIVRS